MCRFVTVFLMRQLIIDFSRVWEFSSIDLIENYLGYNSKIFKDIKKAGGNTIK